MKKSDLIKKISQFFLDNDLTEEIDLRELNRTFETSTGVEEGAIEIISVGQQGFLYTPAGHLDEIDGEYEVLSESDLEEILETLDDYKTDMDKTMERTRD